MDKSDSEKCVSTTPIRSGRKSLGVRRSITKTQLTRTPLSDIKKNEIVKCLKNSDEQCHQSPKTPLTGLKSMRLSSSSSRNTNSNSYKSSLTRAFENQNKKKKLNFYSQESDDKKDLDLLSACSPLRSLPQSPGQNQNESSFLLNTKKNLLKTELNSYNLDLESLTEDELKEEIRKKIEMLEISKKREKEINELNKQIEIWRNGFRASFIDLRNNLGRQDNEELLEQLQLQKQLIQYL